MIVAENLLRQTRRRFPRFESAEVKISPIEKGGSGRKFYRIKFSPKQTVVLVKYARDQSENLRYVEIAEFLSAHEVRAPKVYFHDPEEGLIWIEDLGENDLWSHRDEGWASLRRLYHSALEDLAKLHRIPRSEFDEFARHLPAQFDAALYLWEQHYFMENCLGRHFGVEAGKLAELASLPRLKEIAERLASFPRILVHRDFQSQNIIIREGQAYLIDFQGMRPGLAEYDLASLVYDPYMQLNADQRVELLQFYRLTADVADPAFAEKLRLCAMQRLMQALGAYGKLGHVDQRLQFLEHIPAAVSRLRDVLARIPGVDRLRALLAEV